MKELINQIGRVKKFIGFGSLIVIVLFQIIKQILQLGIFSPLESKGTYNFLILIIKGIFIIAIVTIVITALVYTFEKYNLSKKNKLKEPNIEIVSVIVEEQD